jgi:hypothetical protein
MENKMDHIVLIDNENLCFIKATPTAEQAQMWADILIPTSDYYITNVDSLRSLSVYTPYELRLLYQNTVGEPVNESIKYQVLLEGIQKLGLDLIVDETPLATLGNKAKRCSKETKAAVKETKKQADGNPTKPEKTKEPSISKPAKRPKEGSMTGKVWAVADALHTETGTIPDRKAVIAACEAEGVNPSTASTQYGKWKKHLQTDPE